jgi:hypothetical protein
MFKHIVAAALSLLTLLNAFDYTPIYAQETETEATSESEFTWDPAPIDIDLGQYQLTVWFLFAGVEAPESGYLILKDDYTYIRTLIKDFDGTLKEVKLKEREICNSELSLRDNKCKDLNDTLLLQVDVLKDKNENLDKKYISLSKRYTVFRVATYSIGAIAVGTIVILSFR